MRGQLHRKPKALLATLLALVIFPDALTAPLTPEKLKPEEVVAKHLASIGPAEAIAAARTRIMVGFVNARLRLTNTPVEVSGPAQLASDGNKVLLAMLFNSSNYPFEKAGFDGNKLTVGALPTGGRSPLGSFLMSQDAVFKLGLIGGVLSSAWPLYNLDLKNTKLSYSGEEKVNGRAVHKLKYMPRNIGSLQISLYFDAETFQHLRTQYEYLIPARQGATAVLSASQRDSHYKLIEDFSDFQSTGKLLLPHAYNLELVVETQDKTQTLEWAISFSQFTLDQPIDQEVFNVARSK